MVEQECQKIAIAGSSGFVGRGLIEALLNQTSHKIVCLSRRPREYHNPRLESRACDFYSLKDAEDGLAGCHQAIYLIHSMSVSNRLSQGDFADFDYVLADNFARAAHKAGIKNIIYIGGMSSDEHCKRSLHLDSRIEVEHVLSSYQGSVTVMRCSMIIGPHGSSFLILKKLVKRLPIMGLPKWIKTRCQPIYIQDIIAIIIKTIEHPCVWGRIYDCGSPQAYTYKSLIQEISKSLGVKRLLFDLPYIPIVISKLWVWLFSGADKSLLYPLIDSVNTTMLLGQKRRLPPEVEIEYTPIEIAINESIHKFQLSNENLAGKPSFSVKIRNEVRSIQRLPLPPKMNAYHIARLYTWWLPRFLSKVLVVRKNQNLIRFYLTGLKWPLLVLRAESNRSYPDRQLFYIDGGLLSRPTKRGRLEFRIPRTEDCVIAAIHDFQPRLPWWIYRFSQAVAHKFVMSQFRLTLNRIKNKREKFQAKTA